MKQIIYITIILIALTTCKRTDCEGANVNAQNDFENSDFTFHSPEILPVEQTYFYVLGEYFDVDWKFIDSDSLEFYKCYDSTMTLLLNAQLGFDLKKKAHYISDSLERLPKWFKGPEFEGGLANLGKFIIDRLKISKTESEEETRKKILLEFYIDENGKVINPILRKGTNEEVDLKLIEIANKIPNWTPGYEFGKPIKRRFVLPMYIDLKQN